MTDPAKRIIHKFNFRSEGAHVALVDKAANLQTVLTMKASDPEVTVELSMKDFLEKFFHMWSEDATQLARILGYSGDPTVTWGDESYDEYIQNKIDTVRLLKGQDIPEKVPQSIVTKVQSLMKSIGDKLNSEDSPLETKTLEEEKKLSDVTITLEELEVLKSAKQEVELLKSTVDALKAEKDAKAKQEMITLVKGYSFISEEDQEGVADFLLKSEGSDVMVATLEKARDAITAAVEIEAGVEGEGTEPEFQDEVTQKQAQNDMVSDILKKRNS